MPRIIISRNQSLFDIAIQYYGELSGVFDMVRKNHLLSIQNNIYEKDTLTVADVAVNARIKHFLEPHLLSTLTDSIRTQGIGWLEIGRNFIVG